MTTNLTFKKKVFADLNNIWMESATFQANNGTSETHIQLHISNKKDEYNKQLSSICEALKSILNKESNYQSPFCRVFLSDAANQQKSALEKLKEIGYNGTISVIQQPPLDGTKIAIWCYMVSNFVKTKYPDITIYKHNNYTHFWNTQIGCNGDSYQQTVELLSNENKILNSLDMNITNNCIRTWFFMQNIDRTYKGMVVARREEFEKIGLTSQTHYITSTGIEGRNANPNELVHLDSYNVSGLQKEQMQFLKGTSHLNPTIEYGVTFERGVQILYGDRKHVFLSGTASINNKGEILHENSVEKQSYRMLENCEVLLAEAGATLNDLTQVIIYLRDVADYSVVNEIFEKELPNTPKVIVLAPVCRPGWLIEIEGIAITTNSASQYPNY